MAPGVVLSTAAVFLSAQFFKLMCGATKTLLAPGMKSVCGELPLTLV